MIVIAQFFSAASSFFCYCQHLITMKTINKINIFHRMYTTDLITIIHKKSFSLLLASKQKMNMDRPYCPKNVILQYLTWHF